MAKYDLKTAQQKGNAQYSEVSGDVLDFSAYKSQAEADRAETKRLKLVEKVQKTNKEEAKKRKVAKLQLVKKNTDLVTVAQSIVESQKKELASLLEDNKTLNASLHNLVKSAGNDTPVESETDKQFRQYKSTQTRQGKTDYVAEEEWRNLRKRYEEEGATEENSVGLQLDIAVGTLKALYEAKDSSKIEWVLGEVQYLLAQKIGPEYDKKRREAEKLVVDVKAWLTVEKIKSFPKRVFGAVGKTLRDIPSRVEGAAFDALQKNRVGRVAYSAYQGSISAISSVGAYGKAMGGKGVDTFKWLSKTLGDMRTSLSNFMRSAKNKAADALSGLIDMALLAGLLAGIVAPFLSGLNDGLNKMFGDDWMKQLMKNVWEDASDFFMDKLRDWFPSIFSFLDKPKEEKPNLSGTSNAAGDVYANPESIPKKTPEDEALEFHQNLLDYKNAKTDAERQTLMMPIQEYLNWPGVDVDGDDYTLAQSLGIDVSRVQTVNGKKLKTHRGKAVIQPRESKNLGVTSNSWNDNSTNSSSVSSSSAPPVAPAPVSPPAATPKGSSSSSGPKPSGSGGGMPASSVPNESVPDHLQLFNVGIM